MLITFCMCPILVGKISIFNYCLFQVTFLLSVNYFCNNLQNDFDSDIVFDGTYKIKKAITDTFCLHIHF